MRRQSAHPICFDWLLLSTTRGVQIQVLAAKAEESSRFAQYSADSLVRFVWRNVPWIVSCTICALSHKLFSRGADASRGGTQKAAENATVNGSHQDGSRACRTISTNATRAASLLLTSCKKATRRP